MLISQDLIFGHSRLPKVLNNLGQTIFNLSLHFQAELIIQLVIEFPQLYPPSRN